MRILLYWFPFFTVDANRTLRFRAAVADSNLRSTPAHRHRLWSGIADRLLRRATGAIVFSVIALLGYWALMHAYGDYSMAGNAEIRFDKWVLGEAHMYHGEGVAFDPEGILSTLPAIVNVLAGYLAARFVREHGTSRSTIVRLLLAGAICIGLALWWDTVFPINKKIWTSSFVLCTVGIDLVVLAILICVVPETQERRWTYFFEVFGRNTLAIYLLAELGQIVLQTIHMGHTPCMSGCGRPASRPGRGQTWLAVVRGCVHAGLLDCCLRDGSQAHLHQALATGLLRSRVTTMSSAR